MWLVHLVHPDRPLSRSFYIVADLPSFPPHAAVATTDHGFRLRLAFGDRHRNPLRKPSPSQEPCAPTLCGSAMRHARPELTARRPLLPRSRGTSHVARFARFGAGAAIAPHAEQQGSPAHTSYRIMISTRLFCGSRTPEPHRDDQVRFAKTADGNGTRWHAVTHQFTRDRVGAAEREAPSAWRLGARTLPSGEIAQSSTLPSERLGCHGTSASVPDPAQNPRYTGPFEQWSARRGGNRTEQQSP
jgi:hypothetical protein